MGGRYDPSTISRAESGHTSLRLDGATNAARALGVSLDYLVGLTNDPTPSIQLSGAAPIAEIRASYDANGHDWDERRPVEVLEIASAAGVGAEVYDETPVGLLWFRSDWLGRQGIKNSRSNIISVRGASMEPTLPDGCAILVDRDRQEPHEGHIYVMRTEEGLVVKRLGKDEKNRWLAMSDNPDWEPALLNYGTDIMGEVRWVARTL